MRFRNKSDEVQNIDISPLIDMVFILLIFFMVSSTFVKDMKLELNRPTASSSTKASAKVIRVYIDSYGDTYVDNQQVKQWAIQNKVRDLLHVSLEKSVLVITDDGVEAQKLIDVVDQCRLAGAKDLAVSTQHEAG
ncbi:MAG: biopolymer transporter ExbD [Campylobacterales bacterium]|nr:biopolymer transporter ExbD [Campylobacterales bacterium]